MGIWQSVGSMPPDSVSKGFLKVRSDMALLYGGSAVVLALSHQESLLIFPLKEMDSH